jgi:hypothetical protein
LILSQKQGASKLSNYDKNSSLTQKVGLLFFWNHLMSGFYERIQLKTNKNKADADLKTASACVD